MPPAEHFERPASASFSSGAAKPVGKALAIALGNLGRRVQESSEEQRGVPLDVKGAGRFQAAKEDWLMLLASLPNLSGADYAVGIIIVKHLNSKKFIAWPSLKTIAKLSNRNESTAWRSVERLIQFGLLEARKGRGRHRSNVYQLRLGAMGLNPKTLRRRNKRTASSQAKHCELAV